MSLELQVCSYYDGNLAVLLSDWNNGEPEPWGDLTVNLGMTMEKNCALLDINQLGEEIQTWVEKNRLGTPTGRMERSGFVVYPEYRFNPERLKELDDKGYAEYTAMLEKQKSSKQKEPER